MGSLEYQELEYTVLDFFREKNLGEFSFDFLRLELKLEPEKLFNLEEVLINLASEGYISRNPNGNYFLTQENLDKVNKVIDDNLNDPDMGAFDFGDFY